MDLIQVHTLLIQSVQATLNTMTQSLRVLLYAV